MDVVLLETDGQNYTNVEVWQILFGISTCKLVKF